MTNNPKKNKEARRKRAKIAATHVIVYEPDEYVSHKGVTYTRMRKIIKKV